MKSHHSDCRPAEDFTFWSQFWGDFAEEPFVGEEGIPLPPSIPRHRRHTTSPVRKAAIAFVESNRDQAELTDESTVEGSLTSWEFRPIEEELQEGALLLDIETLECYNDKNR